MDRASDKDFHEERAKQEWRSAEDASDPGIARIHRELGALHSRRSFRTIAVND